MSIEKIDIGQAVSTVKQMASKKFVEKIDIDVLFDIQKDQGALRGFIDLPHDHGKKSNMLIFADDIKEFNGLGDKDLLGGQELIDSISQGTIPLKFDVCISHIKMMPKIAKIAKILGPKKIMPNPKDDTVIKDSSMLSGIVGKFKKNRLIVLSDKQGAVKSTIGTVNYSDNDIIENIKCFVASLCTFNNTINVNSIKKIVLSTTMSAGSVSVKAHDCVN